MSDCGCDLAGPKPRRRRRRAPRKPAGGACVVSPKGKVFACYPSRKQAEGVARKLKGDFRVR